MGIRSRDQVWQLLLVGVTASLLLVVAGILAFRGRDDAVTAAGTEINLPEPSLQTELVAGPVSDVDATDTDDEVEDISTTIAQTTTTDLQPTTEAPPTTEASTTVTTVSTTDQETTTLETSIPETTIPDTTPETTIPETTIPEETTTSGPLVTIRPRPFPGDSTTPAEVAEAKKRWAASGYDSYSMVVQRSCFCAWVGPFEVIVRNGEVQSVRSIGFGGGDDDDDDDDDDEQPTIGLDPNSLTVPGLFDTIDGAMDADFVEVDFDKQSGLPLRINIDYISLAVDDEMLITVTNFSPNR